MTGPEIGLVAYSEPGGNLQVKITIEFGQPNTSYDVFLVGGPSHAMASGFIGIGTLITDAMGAGGGAFMVPQATLLAPPFGPGYRTDHIDMLKGVGDLSSGSLTAGAINYFVCREKDQPGHPGIKVKVTEAFKGARGQGDPHGPKSHQSDPVAGKKR
jgi:hypothetical protein